MEESLRQLGLTAGQIAVYLDVLKNDRVTPPEVAGRLDITRSNAYKVLDRLVDMNLISRQDVNKKFVYQAEDPIALAELLAEQRNRMFAMEKSVKESVEALRATYRRTTSKTAIKIVHGRAKVKQAYEQQAALQQPIHFIPSPSDIPTMGYETMHVIRRLVKQYGQRRFGLVADHTGAPINPAIDEHTNLTRTWLPAGEYTAPVEWSVSGDELTLYVYEKDGSAIIIKNQAVADSFRELWNIMDRHMRRDPEYAELPRKAQRRV